jgi:UDP-2,3-diacylglucosamine pyrophosphatase LpxH
MQKTYRSIFISDVHLGTKDSQADKLNNFLKHNTSRDSAGGFI